MGLFLGLLILRYDRKSDDDDNDGCNDNHDSNDWNFEDNDEKLSKNKQLLWLLSKNEPILGTITWWKKMGVWHYKH